MKHVNFTLAFSLIILLVLSGCVSVDLMENIDCSKSTLELSLIEETDASSCSAADGALTVAANGGMGPYTYSISTLTNLTGNFSELPAGNYELKVVDANSCERTINVILQALGSTLSMEINTINDTACLSDNGSITATAIGGVAPYEFRLNEGVFGSVFTFSNLKSGSYSVEVKDSQGCVFVQNTTVVKGSTGVSFISQIKPIISSKCAIPTCHNGDNGADRNWTVFSNVKANALNIKTRTGNRSMPLTGSLSQDEINLIACWVDDGAEAN